MDIKRLKALSGLNESYSQVVSEEKYYTNDDRIAVSKVVKSHLESLGAAEHAPAIFKYIRSEELDANITHLHKYIEDILAGEFWYPGRKSPFAPSQVVSEEENVSVETIVDAIDDLDHMIQSNGNAIGLDNNTIYRYHSALSTIAEEIGDNLRESEVNVDTRNGDCDVDAVMYVTSQLFDMAQEFATAGKPNRASLITKLAKRLQSATGDQ
tara:strand:- start:399 stop:1031 length:633 start_codon:yes stop_codon:yes gene_type:complete